MRPIALLAATVVVAVAAVCAASPGWPLVELLGRAETVAQVTLETHDADAATFTPTKLVRGTSAKLVLRVADALPDGVTRYVVISQGDAQHPPTDAGHLGQGIAGQRGYRGWLLYPIRRIDGHDVLDPALLVGADGTVTVEQLPALVKQHAYQP